jgi:transcriptional regulator GlxA family with amidase domain
VEPSPWALHCGGKRSKISPITWKDKLHRYAENWRVIDFMEEHLAEDISLHVLADLVRLSPYHFLRSFKQSFGEPPHRYWTARRIERAKALLANPRTSITEIAFGVGFSATSAFSAAFHRIAGQTPKTSPERPPPRPPRRRRRRA